MIASSPSPTFYPQHSSPRNVWIRPSLPSSSLSTAAAAAALRRRRSAPITSADMRSSYLQSSPRTQAAIPHPTRDASTQYSSPETTGSDKASIRGKRKAERADEETTRNMSEDDEPPKPRLTPQTHASVPGQGTSTTSASSASPQKPAAIATEQQGPSQTKSQTQSSSTSDSAPSKRARPLDPAMKIVPIDYEDCPTSDLVPIIASMLMELIRHNDDMPVTNTGLTRFHSRAPPGISVQDYLQRLAHHATLSPPILLCMVYYIDRLCAIWPKFTINSLTVHRYLIASATVASKGLSDSFWTNSTYARVGGVSLKELALLELEFLWRIEWRIVPKPEILVDYYRSLVQRCQGYEIAGPDGVDERKDSTGGGEMVLDS